VDALCSSSAAIRVRRDLQTAGVEHLVKDYEKMVWNLYKVKAFFLKCAFAFKKRLPIATIKGW